jgi:hypothetical protein
VRCDIHGFTIPQGRSGLRLTPLNGRITLLKNGAVRVKNGAVRVNNDAELPAHQIGVTDVRTLLMHV